MHRFAYLFSILFSLHCGSVIEESASEASEDSEAETRPTGCPAEAQQEGLLSGVTNEQRTLNYWLAQHGDLDDLDEIIMTQEAIAAHGASARDREFLSSPVGSPIDSQVEGALFEQVVTRIESVNERIQSGRYVTADGSRAEPMNVPSALSFAPRVVRAESLVPLYCGPAATPLYTTPIDTDFNRNLCSTARPGELIEILAPVTSSGTEVFLARTAYTLGFVTPDLARLPRVDAGDLDTPEYPALTRRAFLTEAFSHLGEPYGWGGQNGGRDCSRFLLDVFAHFGLELPRNSAIQAQSGPFVTNVESMSNDDKALYIQAANREGIVLLQFPGHIMLYLGETEDGVPMVLHSFSEYLTPCEGTELETVNRVDRVDVSDLTLGENSSRTDFLSRITSVTMFAENVGALRGSAQIRDALTPAPPDETADSCQDSQSAAIFRSPFRPNPSEPLRVIATMSDDPGPATLALYGPDGELVTTDTRSIGGPPFSLWTELDAPAPGDYIAVVGDGPKVVACERFSVARHAPPREFGARPSGIGPAWVPRWAWEEDTENLFSAFVEQLFLEPTDADPAWSNLQELLSDPSRNLLYNHRHLREDERLDLEPDCADLPYFLRAYFAWKVRLPFAWRQCRRGRNGRPPTCEAVAQSNLVEVEAASDFSAFERVMRTIKMNVHSSSNRTLPDDENTDVYPIELSREALRPGTVFADPYGHILIVAGWRPQTLDGYGMLVGADAQPDGTVGRRRFWRGSFLFTPDTNDSGAGFKAWRPVSFDRAAGEVVMANNRFLSSSRARLPISRAQYEGTLDDFYETMEGIINPRPLRADAVMAGLVEALHEAAERRVLSVDNGEAWVRDNRRTMPMPEGASIFQTSGPWEDFATPSRDMRLLIAIDAVMSIGDQVRRNPGRFGVSDESAEVEAERLDVALSEALESRSIQYTRSNGESQSITLKQLVERAEALEMAYNPNDCLEIRWGADAEEMTSCTRNAPAAQRRAMEQYRSWFQTRQRPAR